MKLITITAFLIIILISASSLLVRQDVISEEINTATAGYLNTICSDPQNDRDKYLCYGRITGFMMGWAASDLADVNASANKRIMCPEQYIEDGAPALGIGVFIEWMKRHPEAAEKDYIQVLSIALPEAFSCKKAANSSSATDGNSFTERLDEKEAPEKFSKFISDNDGKVVYIDTFIPVALTFSSDDREGFTTHIECGEDYGCPGDEYIINLPDNVDAIYQYVPRLEQYHIKGHWSVIANTALNQGISSNTLRGVGNESVMKLK